MGAMPPRLSFRRNGFAFTLLLAVTVVTLCCAGRLCSATLQDPATTTESAAPKHLFTFSPPASTSTSSSSSPFAPSGKDYPNPTSDPAACNRPAGRPSWLCDPDALLPRGSADEIEGILRDIAQAKKPFAASACAGQHSGYQVALAALGRLDLSSSGSSSASDAAEEFAAGIMDLWGVGHAGCDDGVVIVLSREDRQVGFSFFFCFFILDADTEGEKNSTFSPPPPPPHTQKKRKQIQSYILAGRGSLSKLPPKASSAILEAAKPLLRAGDFAGALKQIVVDVGLTLAGAPPPSIKSSSFDWSTLFFFAVVLAIVVTSARAAAQQRAQQRAASEAVEKLRREQAAAEAAARSGGGGEGAASAPSPFASPSCPVCLEDFTPVEGAEDDDDGGERGGGGGGGVLGGSGGNASDAPPPSAPLLPGFFRSASSSSPSAPPPHRRRCVRPLTMHCGHVFCGDCIARWTDGGHDTCPICRSPLAAAAAARAQAAAAGAAPAASPPSSPSRPRPSYRDELAFRLGSLHRLYPAVVTAEVLSEWLGQARRGAPLSSWEGARRAQLAEGGRTAGRRRQEGARFGAVGGFGGGGSAGGGGAGSSW